MLWVPIIILSLVTIPLAYAAPGELCFEKVENGLCGMLSGDPIQIFGGVLTPLEEQLTGFSMVIFWGGLLAIIWFKTENIMILGIVGIFVNATIVGISETAQGLGLLLLGVANGILLFQLVRQRVALFS
jgi:hypothetical protein